MPQIASSNCIDTANTDGNCIYPAKALGGEPHKSSNVYFEGKEVEFYDSTSKIDDVEGVKVNPLIPLPCQPGVRTIVSTVNTSVSINGKFPAVTGDQTSLGGTPRPLTGPFQHANIIIGSNL